MTPKDHTIWSQLSIPSLKEIPTFPLITSYSLWDKEKRTSRAAVSKQPVIWDFNAHSCLKHVPKMHED